MDGYFPDSPRKEPLAILCTTSRSTPFAILPYSHWPNIRQQYPRVLINYNTANTDIVRILKTYHSEHRITLLRLQKSARTFLSHAPAFPKERCFLEGSHASPVFLLVRATRRWKRVWRMNAVTMTEGNRS